MSKAETQSQERARTQSGNARQAAAGEEIRPVEDVTTYLREYARQKPEMAALWIFGAGFVLGWKLKPW